MANSKEERSRNAHSVTAVQKLLLEITTDPELFLEDKALFAVMKSQGALAGYANLDRGIRSMALNTQKLIANTYLDGFEQLDQLRKRAIAVLENARSGSRRGRTRNKAGLHQKIKEQDALLHTLDADLGLMTDAVSKLISCARSFAEEVGTSEAKARWKRELRLIEAGLKLRSKPLPASNVTDINAANSRKKAV